MSPEAYWARIKLIPLIPERDTSDQKGKICRAQDGTPVQVTKPELLKENQREAAVELLESFYSPAKLN